MGGQGLKTNIERETTLFFLKPDAVIRRYVGARVLKEVLKLNPDIHCFTKIKVSRSFLAEVHYRVHKNKLFFNWLLDYVTSGPIILLIIQKHSIIDELRKVLGPTRPEIAANESPNSLRAKYGIYGGINVAHASDSLATAVYEVKNWISNFHLLIDPQATKKVEEYVSNYIDFPYIDSLRYRELSEEIRASEHEKTQMVNIFLRLLSTETDMAKETLTAFAEVMIKNCLLR